MRGVFLDAKAVANAIESTANLGEEVVEPNRYQQLLQHPIAGLVRSTDERPDVADVAVLGYN